MPDQFSNEYNKIAHYKTTAEEIWRQTNGKVGYFVSAIGTSVERVAHDGSLTRVRQRPPAHRAQPDRAPLGSGSPR